MAGSTTKLWRWVAVLAIVVLVTWYFGGKAWHDYQFPYGHTHHCDKMISFALLRYAEQHEGWFPKGEKSAEASLSLLYQDEPGLTCALPGKTVPESVVKERLESGKLLTPETCGWHYVPGLHLNDDPQLALFWDKAGLGHNGQRLSRGGHFVCFRTGLIEYIPGDRWEQFIADQEKLHSQLKRPVPDDWRDSK